MEHKVKALNVRMPEKMKLEFDAICEENNVNTSALVRSWIDKYIEDNKAEK